MTWTINELCGFRVDFSDACLRPNPKLVIWRYACDAVKISLSMSSASPNMFPSCLTPRQKVSLDVKCIHSVFCSFTCRYYNLEGDGNDWN